MDNPEIERIRKDLARAKAHIKEMEGGTRGDVPIDSWSTSISTKTGLRNGVIACRNQLAIRQSDVARLEMELVQAMIPTWTPAKMIEWMEAPAEPVSLISKLVGRGSADAT